MGEARLYYVPLAFQCLYGRSNERGENGDGNEGSEIPGRGERSEITWRVGGRPEGNGRTLTLNLHTSKNL